ncbi:MAG: hypothetical protein AAF641_13095 [Pseudomonadota bacterium]
MLSSAITRPELTLPAAEAELVRAAYADARVVLEYGSGGSTVMGAEMPGKRVFSVESDQAWAQMMRDWFDQNPPATGSEAQIIWSDIGPTKEWGHPKDSEEYLRYARYPLEVWDLPEFEQPDVVLVDGRFRPGCAMAAALRTQKLVTVFIDDYSKRKHYHRVEKYLGQPRLTGRMAEFAVTPLRLEAGELLTLIDMMTRP